MQYYLGVDIGTTATKAVAISPKGKMIAIETIYYSMQHPQPGWSEQDATEILHTVITCINKLVAALAPQTPAFISFSAAMHSILAVDQESNAITPAIIWADNRAAAVAEELRNTEQGRSFYQHTGVPIHSMSPLCKLLWWKKNEPTILSTTYKFISIKEYVFLKLFGQYLVDTSIASATGLLQLESLQWDEEIVSFIGIRLDQLSPIVATKQVLYYTGSHRQLTIPLHTPIVIGGSDGALSNLGTAANKNLVVTIGTSGAVRMLVTEPQTDPHMRTFCYHVKDREYIIGGATNNGAVVLQWLKETLLGTEASYEELLGQAQHVSPGSDGLLFLPYLLGERAPIWNAKAKGVFFGLTLQHSKAHLVRACMEGVLFGLYSIGNILFEKQETDVLYATGGFARSELWLQLLADVFNKKVLVSSGVESSALGAVVVGAEALGLEWRMDNATPTVYHPNAEHHFIYQKSFEKFQRLYELLKEEML
jgi:gluconokinase